MDTFQTESNNSKQEFENARFKSLLNSLRLFLIGRENELLSFDKIRKGLSLRNQKYLGIKTVSIDNIVGSLGRYKDFDRYFLPKKVHLMQRWLIYTAHSLRIYIFQP